MFTQRLSMDCTKEQYEKYLKDELLKMGYKEMSIDRWDCQDFQYISNSYAGFNGRLGTIHRDYLDISYRTYLGTFNAPLFLALAAMTDKAEGNYGEYIVSKFTGSFYRMSGKDFLNPKDYSWRKATKEEIIERFDNNKEPMWESCSNIIKNFEEIYTAIELLKSNGYKIMRKIETWEEV